MTSRPLVLLIVMAWACGENGASSDTVTADADVASADEAEVDTPGFAIDVAAIEPGMIVLAARSGGAASTKEEAFFDTSPRHGWRGAWMYGDGRVITIDYLTALGYRVYRQRVVSVQEFQDLLLAASKLSVRGKQAYSCFPDELGYENLAVNLPGLSLEASAHTSFSGCQEAHEETDVPSPADVVALAEKLLSLDLEATEATVLESEKILLAGFDIDAATYREEACAAEDVVEWPFADVELPVHYSDWTLSLEGSTAVEVRAFVREHLRPPPMYWYGSACVAQGDDVYRVFYDDVPDGEEAWPF